MRADSPKKTKGRRPAPPAPEARAAVSEPASRPVLPIPPILLEGDAPSTSPPSGPGQRYALAQSQIAEPPARAAQSGDLPEAYGTKRLHLTARDPHALYAHWDLTRQQLEECNSLSADQHLVLRIYKETTAGEPGEEIQLHPESRNWLVHIDQGGAKYVAQLGYYK